MFISVALALKPADKVDLEHTEALENSGKEIQVFCYLRLLLIVKVVICLMNFMPSQWFKRKTFWSMLAECAILPYLSMLLMGFKFILKSGEKTKCFFATNIN